MFVLSGVGEECGLEPAEGEGERDGGGMGWESYDNSRPTQIDGVDKAGPCQGTSRDPPPSSPHPATQVDLPKHMFT